MGSPEEKIRHGTPVASLLAPCACFKNIRSSPVEAALQQCNECKGLSAQDVRRSFVYRCFDFDARPECAALCVHAAAEIASVRASISHDARRAL